MKSKSTAGMTAKQKTVVGVLLAIVVALLWGGVSLLFSAAEKPALAETPTISGWYVDESTAEKAADSSDYLVSVSLKGASTSISCATTYTADAAHGYIAVKYSGTAVFSQLSIYGSKGDETNINTVVADVAPIPGWNVKDDNGYVTVGTDFSIAVAYVGSYYGTLDIDTVTNIGFNITGSAGNTFTVYGIELMSSRDGNHNFGTPTPPAELTWGDWTSENVGWVELSNANGANRTVDIKNVQDQPEWGQHAYIGAAYDAKADYKYISVKYKGNATLDHITLFNDVANKYVSAVVVSDDNTTAYGSGGDAFKVVTADISSYYANVDNHVTKIGFNIKGKANETLQILGIELTPDGLHTFAPRGEMTISEMKLDTAAYGGTYTLGKDDNNQTVSQTKMWGGATTYTEVEFYDATKKYLVVELMSDQALNFGLGTKTNQYPDITGGYVAIPANTRKTLAYDVSGLNLNDIKQEIHFFFGNEAWGADPVGWTERTVTFYNISFSETDPTASSESNHFREPTGSNVTYTPADKKITYTNTAAEYWRYVEIALDNHDVSYDVLSINITGYNGLVLGVRVLYNDEVEGSSTSATLDVIPSSAYYSKIETDDAVELVIYLEAYGLKGREVTGVQLYLDAPAGAGKVGDVELTLNGIEMLKSGEGAFDPADTAITAENVTVEQGETPDFNVTLKSGETTVDGKVITEYRTAGTTNSYTAGLPVDAGEYEVRFYYMGSREYKYSRSTTATLKINAPEKTLASIAVTTQPTKTTYTVGDTIDLAGLVVTATYSDESTAPVAVTAAMLSDYDMTKAGTYHVKVTYEGKTATFDITVNAATATKTLSSIAVTTKPTKTTYTVGDKLDLAGLVVTATYSDESTAPVTVTAAMLSDYDMAKAGTYHVKVTYEGKTATFDITVKAAQASGNGSDEGLTGGEIAIIVIAVVVCLGAVAAAIVVVLRKKKNGQSKE